ncbi:MAG: helix-turn-helix transcriptional regulator [Bdellovibrionales bacterium]|nr:helix-turn-helix transcriptional regulator [Bdellovibrionales bacterium]
MEPKTGYMKIELQQVLKRELKSKHLTINGLARECKIPVSVLHSWIQGVLPSAKNLHHIASLAKFLELPVSVILFDRDEAKPNATVLFNSEFADGEHKYRLSVEKIKKERE